MGEPEGKEAQLLQAGQVGGTKFSNPEETGPPPAPDKATRYRRGLVQAPAPSREGGTPDAVSGFSNHCHHKYTSENPWQTRAGATAAPWLTHTPEAHKPSLAEKIRERHCSPEGWHEQRHGGWEAPGV